MERRDVGYTLGLELVGVDLSEVSVRELIHLLDPGDPAARKLQRGLQENHAVVALTFQDRRQLLEVLVDPPDGLRDLRRALLLDVLGRGEKRLP